MNNNTSDGSKKIRVIMESIHDPILTGEKFEVSLKISKDSFLNESYFDKRWILVTQHTFNSKANLTSTIRFKYDENQNNTERISYKFDGSLITKKINKFDNENRLIESHELDERGKIISKKTTRYDSAGFRIFSSYEWTSYASGLLRTLESVFDKNENNVANLYFSDNKLVSKETNRYDENGNLVEAIQYNPLTGEQIIKQCQYDEQNNKVGIVVLRNNLVNTKSIFKYDAKNNLIGISSYGVLGTLEAQREFLYEFDAEGNWTKRIHIFNKKPISVLIRRIKYY